MPNLDTKIPPPVLALLTALLMWALARHFPPGWPAWPLGWPPAGAPRQALAGALALAGLACDLAGLWAFRRARTTVNPLHPERSSAIVTGGIYRLTRNPMYLGMLLVLSAWALWLGQVWAWVGPPLFVAWMNRFQIGPEERALQARFGEAYAAYRSRVRRWL